MKPILFSTPMVQAILDGKKTQTRRVIKPQPVKEATMFERFIETVDCGLEARFGNDISTAVCDRKVHYKPSDILWVRETWRATGVISEPYAYKADEEVLNLLGESGQILSIRYAWRPSIHMPREAARIFLRVINVRVERLQEITEEDAVAEGIDWLDEACYENNGWHPTYYDPDSGGQPVFRDGFIKLWDSLNAKRGYGWDTNPWVWVIEFERCEKPEVNNEH